MLGLMLSILLGLFGGFLLKIFYSMAEKEEPESYLYNLSKLQRTKDRAGGLLTLDDIVVKQQAFRRRSVRRAAISHTEGILLAACTRL